MAIASLGFGIVGCNKTENTSEEVNQLEVQEDDLDYTYIDDNYEMPEDVDLNEEFEDRVESNKNNQSNSNDKDDNSDNDDIKEETNSNTTNNSNSNNNESQVTVTEKTGIFQGFADDNFVEIKVGNEYSTYRVSTDAKNSLSNKNLGDSVTFEFTKQNGQLFIVSAK